MKGNKSKGSLWGEKGKTGGQPSSKEGNVRNTVKKEEELSAIHQLYHEGRVIEKTGENPYPRSECAKTTRKRAEPEQKALSKTTREKKPRNNDTVQKQA